jgi:hypothetical protein
MRSKFVQSNEVLDRLINKTKPDHFSGPVLSATSRQYISLETNQPPEQISISHHTFLSKQTSHRNKSASATKHRSNKFNNQMRFCRKLLFRLYIYKCRRRQVSFTNVRHEAVNTNDGLGALPFSLSLHSSHTDTAVQQPPTIACDPPAVNSASTLLHKPSVTRKGFRMRKKSAASSLEEVVVRARRRQPQEMLLLDAGSIL